MKTYRVTIRQASVQYYEKEFQAESLEQAEELAQADQEDGLDGWALARSGGVTEEYIDYVEELK